MNLRTPVRILIAASFLVSGLVESLSATGLSVEFSSGGLLGNPAHILAVSGPLQVLGAVLIASGRKTRWAFIVLGCYIFLVSVFGNVPLIFKPEGVNAIAGLAANVAILGGILYWLHGERSTGAAKPVKEIE